MPFWKRNKTLQEIIPQTTLEFKAGDGKKKAATVTIDSSRTVLQELSYHLEKAGIDFPQIKVGSRITIKGDDNIEKLLGILEKLSVEPKSLALPPLNERDVYSSKALQTTDISMEEIKAYEMQKTPKLAHVGAHLALAKKDKSVVTPDAPDLQVDASASPVKGSVAFTFPEHLSERTQREYVNNLRKILGAEGRVTEYASKITGQNGNRLKAIKIKGITKEELFDSGDVTIKSTTLLNKIRGITNAPAQEQKKGALSEAATAPPDAPADVAHGAYAIAAEGGSGGGYTDENPKDTNSRKSNEDRAIAAEIPRIENADAVQFLTCAANEHIIPATSNILGGSTLSMAMHTREGHVAVATMGDSPVFAIMRQRQTGDVRLMQVSIPHSRAGVELVNAATNRGNFPHPKSHTLDAYIAAAKANDPGVADDFINGKLSRNVTSGLGKLEKGEPHHIPDIFAIDPTTILPSKYEYMGAMVCSDGVDEGVKKGVVQKQLKALYKTRTATPQEISEAVVKAAAPLTNDNVTAMVLPAGKEGLIAVADGSYKTAAVAEMAIEKVREACQEKVRSVADNPAGGRINTKDDPIVWSRR